MANRPASILLSGLGLLFLAACATPRPTTKNAPLARVSHRPSTAAAQSHALTGVRSVGMLDVASATPARPSVANASHTAPLKHLATNAGEKSGLARQPSATEQRLAWHRRLNWPKARCPLKPPFGQDPGITIHPFDDDRSMVEVTCSLGAYQGNGLLYLLDDNGKARALRFLQFHSPDRGQLLPYTDALLTGVIQVEPTRHAIKVWRKYRGIGDCGQLLRYRVSNGKVQLAELRVRDCEDELSRIPPEQWPLAQPPAM